MSFVKYQLMLCCISDLDDRVSFDSLLPYRTSLRQILLEWVPQQLWYSDFFQLEVLGKEMISFFPDASQSQHVILDGIKMVLPSANFLASAPDKTLLLSSPLFLSNLGTIKQFGYPISFFGIDRSSSSRWKIDFLQSKQTHPTELVM